MWSFVVRSRKKRGYVDELLLNMLATITQVRVDDISSPRVPLQKLAIVVNLVEGDDASGGVQWPSCRKSGTAERYKYISSLRLNDSFYL
jgi:hypothetical protein